MVDFIYEKKPPLVLPIPVALLQLVGGVSLGVFLFTFAMNYPTVMKEHDYTANEVVYSGFTFLHTTRSYKGRRNLFVYDKEAGKELLAFAGTWHFGMPEGQAITGGYINHYSGMVSRPVFVFVEQEGNVILDIDLGLERLNARKKRKIQHLKFFASLFVISLLLLPLVMDKKLFYQIIHRIKD